MKKAAAPREPQFSLGEIFLARRQANPKLPHHVGDSGAGSAD